MDLLQALRAYITQNPLPAEAQQIDKVISEFSANYSKNNPPPFLQNADTVHVLCYSMIMLSTDLHTASIAPGKRMSREQFKNLLRDQWKADSFPSDYLDSVYDSILTNPLIKPASYQQSGNIMEEEFASGDREEKIF